MPLHVMFIPVSSIGHVGSLALGKVRASESVALSGTGSLTANDGEMALIHNSETSTIYAAHGSTPSTAATAETAATSARYAVPPGTIVPVKVMTGDKFAALAVS